MESYREQARELPTRSCDVVIAGGGTAGVVAALAAARQGAKTTVIEGKGYLGGIAVEGGTGLHSFYNLWKAFPGVERRQVIGGIPQEVIDRLIDAGGTTGHLEMEQGYGYDSICTAIDTEIFKHVAFEMLEEAGVDICVNTLLCGAIVEDGVIRGVIAESRSGREAIMAKAFVDCTGAGDLSAMAGARFTEPNDHPVANSIGVGGVSVEGYYQFLCEYEAVTELARGMRGGVDGRIVRLNADMNKLPAAFRDEARAIGMACTMTTLHDDYFMFIKLNYKMAVSPTNRDAVAKAEAELRRRQVRAIALFREHVPGCERAFITRTSPSLCIRRGRCIACDYDVTSDDVLDARHFDDDVLAYGFHDMAPRLQIKNGDTYGIPYRALRVAGVENLLAAGMLITSDFQAHMSTRNTVCCMAQGQAAGSAAALCAQRGCGTRDLAYATLREALLASGVILEGWTA